MDEISQELAAMDPTELALGAGLIGVIMSFFTIIRIAWFFISAIGFYKMNIKAGESGWSAFIPVYRTYIRFKYAWNTKIFWVYLAATVCLYLFDVDNFVLSLFVLASMLVIAVLSFMLDLRVVKSFGKSTIWGVLMFVVPFIISLILGFGNAAYIGNTTTAAKTENVA